MAALLEVLNKIDSEAVSRLDLPVNSIAMAKIQNHGQKEFKRGHRPQKHEEVDKRNNHSCLLYA